MDKLKNSLINGLFLALTLFINALGATGRINGLSQKQISDMYDTLITPSSATFSIWSLIYSLLIASVVVMIVKRGDEYYQNATEKITLLFRLSCILNMAWIFAFSYVQIELSAVLIVGFVVTLAMLCQKLLMIHEKKRWLLPVSFGIYTGWLLIASVVNISVALVKLKWNGFGIADETWAVITLITAVFLAGYVLWKIRNAVFPLPIAWAYFGIYRSLTSPQPPAGDLYLLQITSLAGMSVLICLSALQFYKNKYLPLPEPQQPGEPEAK